jgi:histidinol-phosphate/aromatic aminotransferase/cobyric acid decarboxylase-like protein
MIAAWRMPTLTERFMAATLKAAAEARRDAGQQEALAHRLVERLREMGYTIYLDRAA